MHISKGYSVGAGLRPRPGMSLWLRADVGVLDASGNPATDGVAVAAWKDQSGNGNDATQTSPSLKPTWRASIRNGNPACRFTDSSYLNVSMPSRSLTGFYCAAVYQTPAYSQFHTVVVGLNWYLAVGANSSEYNLYLRTSMAAQNPNPINPLIGDWVLLEMVWDGSQSSWYNNQSLITSVSQAGIFAFDCTSISSYSPYGWAGDITELLIYPSALSDADRQHNELYLNRKYNIY